MNFYNEDQDNTPDQDDAGENTMAVLSTIGGEGDALGEDETLGLDPSADKAKISGSSFAVGVVVVIGAVVVLGMKMTLGAIGAGSDPIEAMAQIDQFMVTHNAAVSNGAQGPIKPRDAESQKILDELKQDPTDSQVPAEEVKTNPFDISEVVARPTTDAESAVPQADARAIALEKAKHAAAKLKVDSISGKIVFIDGNMYRIGDAIANSGFKLDSVDRLTCIIRTTDEYRFAFRLRYR